VDDTDKTLEEVVEWGVNVAVPNSKENGNAVAAIADPEGTLFGLHQFVKK
jgi:predicted enzyme related to lactoylglutathione lyase